MSVARGSRYERSNRFLDVDGNLFLGIPTSIDKSLHNDEFSYTIKQGDTLFAIAYLAYQDMDESVGGDIRSARLWTILAEINNVVDATQPLPTGKVFRIPSEDYIRRVIRRGGV